uniref:SET and MYND domain-containing protein 4 n=1 Tax=Anopheles marajoara TaxID=58244 RepID=A0A2M4BHX6_9DIPT
MSERLEEKFGAWELFDVLWSKLCTELPGNGETRDKTGETDRQLERLLEQAWDAAWVRESMKLSRDVKSEEKANAARAKGNSFFHPKVKRYIEAVKQYNECLCHSEPASEARALAYANRSAVCYDLHRYEECLENIRLARAANYPERLADKLAKRELAAKQGLADKAAAAGGDDVTKPAQRRSLALTYEANETVPQVANCLELAESEQFGRHVITNRDLKAGDIVVHERPTHTILIDTYRHVRCDYCLQDRLYTLRPCEGCTVAMYCSDECREQAHQTYHRYECPIVRDMWRIFTKIPLMSLRTVTMAITFFDHNLDAMLEHLDALNEATVNPFAMDWTVATKRDIYNTVHVLATNEHVRDCKDMGQRIFFALIIRHLLLDRTPLGAMCFGDPKKTQFLYDLLLRHLQTVPTNMHSLYYMQYQRKAKAFEPANYASACFPLLSMINHSCAPNMTRVTLPDGSCGVLIIRPIAKGGQLFDNYGNHHCLQDRKTRLTALMRQYRFQCNCEACKNNYAMLNHLPHIDPKRYGMIDSTKIYEDLERHDTKLAEEWYPQLRKFINHLGYQYPRYELSCAQELFLRAFEIQYKESETLEDFAFCNP